MLPRDLDDQEQPPGVGTDDRGVYGLKRGVDLSDRRLQIDTDEDARAGERANTIALNPVALIVGNLVEVRDSSNNRVALIALELAERDEGVRL